VVIQTDANGKETWYCEIVLAASQTRAQTRSSTAPDYVANH
jgi:hypothetical protein